MCIEPYPDSGLWILAAGVRELDIIDIANMHVRLTRQNDFEKCWTGEGWGYVAGAAQRFVTRQEAEDYLAYYRTQMEGT